MKLLRVLVLHKIFFNDKTQEHIIICAFFKIYKISEKVHFVSKF